MNLSGDQQKALRFIADRRHTVYLTGDAGTGKTYLVNKAVSEMERRNVYVLRTASTGIAASHIGGQTTYRAFGITPTERGPHLTTTFRRAAPPQDALIVIEEVSMLRVDVLECVNQRLRQWGNPGLPWGGYQILFVGDWEQLPPVVRPKEVQSVLEASGGLAEGYAFQHPLWSTVRTVRLTTPHRQSGDEALFLRVLRDVRSGKVDQRVVRWMNRTFHRGPAPPDVIRLCNTRRQVGKCNARLIPDGRGVTFTASATGTYKNDLIAGRTGDLPLPSRVCLTVGSRIMCKQNLECGVVNGDLGTLLSVSKDGCLVSFDRHGEQHIALVTISRVEGIESVVEDDGNITEIPQVSGTYRQIPLIPAHAITLHASQGLSLDRAEISMDPKSRFSPAGLLYVGLSRVRSLNGVWLSYPLSPWMFRRSTAVASEARRTGRA